MVVCSSPAAALSLVNSHAPDIGPAIEALITPVDKPMLRELVGSVHPTEIAALASKPSYAADTLVRKPRKTPLVLLDNPRNLGNFGAVIRVAAGMRAAGVVSIGDLDPWHTTILRGSAGLHYAVPVARVSEISTVEGTVIAFDAGGVDATKVRIPSDAVLAFGSERHGLSQAMRERADELVSIPMRHGVSSYNLTTSVAMALYQWTLDSETR